MSMQLLMANPDRRTNGSAGRSNGTRNGLSTSNGLAPINTGQRQTNGFQPLGTEALTDYTNQLAHLEDQNRLRRRLAEDERPQSPVGPQRPISRQYEPRSAVDGAYWSRAEVELSSASTTTSDSQSANDSIYQYQQMLLIEQQRRIREMEETRRQQERQRQREQQERRQ
ncbi:hypothetical protein AC579_6275 [Pseudocercospora musae]|uniref:Uncharacterized protein n=1 Tax=Pseudocercospora musae TaxID=113226 RepID=A0A139IPL8_9PEZI|nr:hypothetical protein AC579_6275 [Pseudocercospora musae]